VISCIIPTTIKEEQYLDKLLTRLCLSGYLAETDFEILIIENGGKGLTEEIVYAKNDPHLSYHYIITPSRSYAKNWGVKQAKGELLIFVDADNDVSLDLFSEVRDKGKDDHFFGGGCKRFRLSSNLIGVKAYFTFMLIVFTLKGIWNPFNPFSVGIFWFRRDHYDKIGGWKEVNHRDLSQWLSFIPEDIQPADDVDLGMRMKEYERETGLKFESLKQTTCTWNTRKFDQKGEWFWLR